MTLGVSTVLQIRPDTQSPVARSVPSYPLTLPPHDHPSSARLNNNPVDISTPRLKPHFTRTVHTASGGRALKKIVPALLWDHKVETHSTPRRLGQADKRRGDGIGAVGGHLEWLIIVAVSCWGVGAEVSASITCVTTIIS